VRIHECGTRCQVAPIEEIVAVGRDPGSGQRERAEQAERDQRRASLRRHESLTRGSSHAYSMSAIRLQSSVKTP
jgi:hypothetical protein